MVKKKNSKKNIDTRGKEKQNKKINHPKIEKDNKAIKRKIYFSYTQRLVICLIFLAIIFLSCLYFAMNSFEFKHPEKINYIDSQEIDYKVYLKENNFYEQEYLEKNMMYVANLIDKITVDFNYKFNIDKASTIDFDYQIIGDLVISNATTKVPYFEKEYILFQSEQNTMENETEYVINKNMELNYDYYNNLANSFKNSYGVESESYLKVYLRVNKNGQKYNLNLANKIENGIKIPLSENSVQIKFDSNDLSNTGEIVIERDWVFQPYMFIFEFITFLISAFLLGYIINLIIVLFKPKSAYDKLVYKILRTYDRLIGETKTGIDLDNYNVIEMKSFEELLDIRDNLKMPIMFYNIADHQKCHFYLKNNDDVYIFRVKAVDLETTSDEKKKY